jgi:adenylosuccinate lyase
MINVIEGLVFHEKTMMKNIHHTRGLIFSQMALLKLIEKGMSREEAYRIVQDAAMKVWNDNQTDLKSELLKHDKINTLLTSQEIGSIFEIKNFFNNLDSIYANANII